MLTHPMCVFIFLQTFLFHQVAQRPRLVSLNGPSLENSQAWAELSLQSLTSHLEHGGHSIKLGCKFGEFIGHL